MLTGLYGPEGSGLLAKIAVELERALARRALFGEAGQATARVLAAGEIAGHFERQRSLVGKKRSRI